MKTKIGRGLLALLVCVQALAAPNAQAQRGADRLFSLPRFERAVACIKHYEGLHGPKNHPYVGYGHRLLPGERLSCAMTKRQADSLLRADLKKRLVTFRRFGRDSLLLAVLYLVHATLRMALRVLFYLIRWLCIAAALAWIVCRLLFLRRSHSNDGERIHRDPLPVTFHRAA